MGIMVVRPLALLVLLLMISACSAPKQTYVVDVRNASAVPLSVGLVKSDGTIEDGWTSPEQIAINAPQLGDRKWGTLIPPGQTKTIGPQVGRFPGGSHGVLRIYAGDLTVDELIGYGRTDPARADIHLWPGRSGYLIDVQNGAVKTSPLQERVEATDAQPGTE